MNLRKRSVQKTFKDDSSDSDNSVKTTKKAKSKTASNKESISKETPASSSNKSELLNESSLKQSKYFSDGSKEKNPFSSEDEFLIVKPKNKTIPKKLDTKLEKPKQTQAKNSNKTKKKISQKTSVSEKNLIYEKSSPSKIKSKIETDIDALLKLEGTQNVAKPSKINGLKDNDDDDDDDDNDDEGDFEEVEMENLHEIDMRIEAISRKGIEITIDDKKKKKAIDMAQRMERLFKALSKKIAIATIKTHILCWLNYGFYLNKISCDKELNAIALSMNFFEAESIITRNLNKKILITLLNHFKTIFNLDKIEFDDFMNKNILITSKNLSESMATYSCKNYLQYIMIVLIALRSVGIKARLCICFDVIEMPEQNKKKLNKNTNNQDSDDDSDDLIEIDETTDKKTKKSFEKSTKRKSKTIDNNLNSESSNKKSKKAKIDRLSVNENENDEAVIDEIKSEDHKENLILLKSKTQNRNNRVLSSDNEEISKNVESYNTNYRHHWLEIYLEEDDEGWVSVEPYSMKVDCTSYLEKRYGKRILYVCGYDNDNKVKDLTKRYAKEWLTTTRRLRVSQLDPKKLWWEKTLLFYQPLDSNLDIKEEIQLKKMLLSKELPKSLPEFKDHPLYVLPKHLLKFQAIYPENTIPISHFRNEKIFLRDNLSTLHSRQTWLKYARVVKPFENAFKVVKGRLKHLFGFWQTKEYEPPIAENGRVPRNEFGNVELFQPNMLPIGCVHLKNMPNLNRLCRKLNIDCAAAVVGFDAHGGFSHAVYDGWIVCEEFKETVTIAFQAYELEEAKKLIQKKKDRILGNWTRLVKHVLVRERLKLKYETKTSLFSKVDKNGKSIGKFLNEDVAIDQHKINLDCDIVGGKLNDVNIKTESSSFKDESQMNNTKKSALFKTAKVSTKSKGNKAVNNPTTNKKVQTRAKNKNNFQENQEEDQKNLVEDSESSESPINVDVSKKIANELDDVNLSEIDED